MNPLRGTSEGPAPGSAAFRCELVCVLFLSIVPHCFSSSIFFGTGARILPAHSSAATRPRYENSVVANVIVGGSVLYSGNVGRISQGVLFYLERSAWELYRWKVLGISAALFIEALLIALLLNKVAKRRRVQLAITEKELAEAQRLAGVGSWLFNPATNAVIWSEELYRIHGLDPKVPLPAFDKLNHLFTSESLRRLNEATKEALRTGVIPEIELEVVCPDGSTRWVHARGEAVRDAAGRVTLLRGTAQDITDRKHIESKLRESQNRLRAVVDSAMDAIISLDDQQIVVLFNPSAEKMFGCSAADAIGSSVERFVPQRFRSEHILQLRHFGEASATNLALGAPRLLWGMRSNGEEFPIEGSISHVEDGGKNLFTVIIRDVTERRRAEEATKESEKRFHLIANTAPVMIWMSGPDKLCNYFNQPWLEFTGRSFQTEIGNGWTEGVHPDDLRKCVDTYTKYFDRREEFRMEYRLRRHDGEYRWVLDKGVPRFNGDNSFAGYVGCCMDISDLKLAKATVLEFSARLMEASEEERARIARELHDDINQRLALLANGLQEAAQAAAESTVSSQQKALQELLQLTNEIASGIQYISHQLHPSKLHYLGLAATVRHLCKEVSQQHRIEVECIVNDLPGNLEENVSLNLFRVVQESLHNVVKHSHAHHVKVELTCHSSNLYLRVSDDGIGFDPDNETIDRGLGVTSMRERMRSVGGTLSIWSKPSLGTQVEGIIPAKLTRQIKETGAA